MQNILSYVVLLRTCFLSSLIYPTISTLVRKLVRLDNDISQFWNLVNSRGTLSQYDDMMIVATRGRSDKSSITIEFLWKCRVRLSSDAPGKVDRNISSNSRCQRFDVMTKRKGVEKIELTVFVHRIIPSSSFSRNTLQKKKIQVSIFKSSGDGWMVMAVYL